MLIFFIPTYGGEIDQLVNLAPKIHIESHSNLNLCPVFYLKAYLFCTEPFGNTQMDPSCKGAICYWCRMLCLCMWVLCSLLVENSDSPSIVEQSQQGGSFQLQFFIDSHCLMPVS